MFFGKKVLLALSLTFSFGTAALAQNNDEFNRLREAADSMNQGMAMAQQFKGIMGPPPPAQIMQNMEGGNVDTMSGLGDNLIFLLLNKISSNQNLAADAVRRSIDVYWGNYSEAQRLKGEACGFNKQVKKLSGRGLILVEVDDTLSQPQEFERRFQEIFDRAKRFGDLLGCDAQTNNNLPRPGIQYELLARHSGKCFDVRDHGTWNGVRLQQWDCTGEPHQKFYFTDVGGGWYNLTSATSGRCVSAEAVRLENGTPMVLWDCNGGPDQKVRLVPSNNGSVTVRFQHSGKCMDVQDFSSDNGKDVHQWDCSGGADQDWYLRPH